MFICPSNLMRYAKQERKKKNKEIVSDANRSSEETLNGGQFTSSESFTSPDNIKWWFQYLFFWSCFSLTLTIWSVWTMFGSHRMMSFRSQTLRMMLNFVWGFTGFFFWTKIVSVVVCIFWMFPNVLKRRVLSCFFFIAKTTIILRFIHTIDI